MVKRLQGCWAWLSSKTEIDRQRVQVIGDGEVRRWGHVMRGRWRNLVIHVFCCIENRLAVESQSQGPGERVQEWGGRGGEVLFIYFFPLSGPSGVIQISNYMAKTRWSTHYFHPCPLVTVSCMILHEALRILFEKWPQTIWKFKQVYIVCVEIILGPYLAGITQAKMF